jgi:DAK2 domain fusion protein YloV
MKRGQEIKKSIVVNKRTRCNGHDLNGMFNSATRWLERSAQSINALNVFPVPDGDTGINMLLTMRAAIDEAGRSDNGSATVVAQAIARGSLMGARGNSGVILSQIFRGLAHGLDGKRTFTAHDFANALAQSADFAYKGVTKPVEGTILTVIREAAAAAQAKSSSNNTDMLAIMETVVEESKASVARTPSLLPVLRQAGVVDAGGQGLYIVFEGALRYLRGDTEEAEPEETAQSLAAPIITAPKKAEEVQYGYCTEFLLHGKGLDPESIREKLITLGESVLVVGDESMIRVHLHTFDPGIALSYASALGNLQQVKVENMDDQHQDFLAAKPQQPLGDISTIAVASGEGLMQVFYSVGATIVVSGGQTMNPSVQELLQAVESVYSDKVIILPNNANIVMAARQVPELTKKQVEVVPTETIPQGIAALLVFNYEADLATNVSAMKTAVSTVHSGEVTTAVRSMSLDGTTVKEGQAIAFLDSELVAADNSMPQVVLKLLDKVDVEKAGLVTIYYGADTEQAEAERIGESVREKYPALEVEVVAGGQPYYNYIVSVE